MKGNEKVVNWGEYDVGERQRRKCMVYFVVGTGCCGVAGVGWGMGRGAPADHRAVARGELGGRGGGGGEGGGGGGHLLGGGGIGA